MIRPVKLQDVKAIKEIYNEYIVHSVATFETEPLQEEEMFSRITGVAADFPYFVYEIDNWVVGYCYAYTWKQKRAYKYTLETTVYVSTEYVGKGLGTLLMQRLIDECRQKGYHVLIACVTAGNKSSDSLHLKLGFKQVGLKFSRWLDVIDYELLLVE